MKPPFRDRKHAGKILAESLTTCAMAEAVVFAIPNGGVAVAEPIVTRLGTPLELIIVRKIPIPGNPEAGFGSVASDGSIFLHEPLVERLGYDSKRIEELAAPIREQIRSRLRQYGVEADYSRWRDRPAIIVDDGLASGMTMRAAIHVVRKLQPPTLIVATPTASQNAMDRIAPLVDDIICPNVRGGFSFAVAEAYERWYDLEIGEVKDIMERLRAR